MFLRNKDDAGAFACIHHARAGEMSKLSTNTRKKLPKSEFGEPGKRAYPMPDKAHAANAKARASQQVKAGKLPAAEAKRIDAKADKVLQGKAR
jgi:hypothetical protein